MFQSIIDGDAETSGVGILTTLDRDSWAEARAKLEANPTNAAALAVIDEAMFVVCLEDGAPETEKELGSVMLHGNGVNRWFDKSFSLIFCANGQTGLTFEHSWGDGVAVLRFCNEVG